MDRYVCGVRGVEGAGRYVGRQVCWGEGGMYKEEECCCVCEEVKEEVMKEGKYHVQFKSLESRPGRDPGK